MLIPNSKPELDYQSELGFMINFSKYSEWKNDLYNGQKNQH